MADCCWGSPESKPKTARFSISKQDEFFVEEGTENVFAELGFADPDSHLLKAQLRSRARDYQKSQNDPDCRQTTGISQPMVSRILRGQFRDVSIERLMRILTRLGCAVDIVVRPEGSPAPSAVIHFNEPLPA